MLCAAGCGGGGGGNSSTTPTITSVSTSCNPTSLQAGQTTQTSQCAATVMGTGSYSSGVTWTVSAGTITSAGVYTAPATVPTPGTATITATSTEDTTKSGAATITITAAPTITSVSASCLPATLPAHQTTQTSQCSATVTGTGSYSSAVTWSAKYGAITTAGVYTAPLTVPTSGTDTVTATSTEDGTKSGPASIAITASRVITLTPKYPAISEAEIPGSPFAVQINATGIQTGDVIDWTVLGATMSYTISAADVTAGYFTANLSINEVSSFVQFNCPVSTNAMCTPAWVAITTDQQQLAESPGETTAYFNPGEVFDIQEYSLPAGTFLENAPLVGAVAPLNTAITVDGGTAGTGVLLSDHNLQSVNSTAGNSTTGVLTVSGTRLASIVAWNGYGYVTEPGAGNLGQFTISATNGLGTISTVTAGNSPYAIDAATVNGADAIVVYSGVDKEVRLFSSAPVLESTSAALSNITAFPVNNQPLPGSQGGWPMRIIGSGSAAGTAGVLSSYDNVLDFLTINSSNQLTWAGATNGAVTFPSGNPYPYLIAPDVTHGAFIVALADTTNGVTTIERISATSPYTATTITPNSALPAGFLASGLLVSGDGSKIYVAGFNTLTAASPTSPTNTPLFFTVANP